MKWIWWIEIYKHENGWSWIVALENIIQPEANRIELFASIEILFTKFQTISSDNFYSIIFCFSFSFDSRRLLGKMRERKTGRIHLIKLNLNVDTTCEKKKQISLNNQIKII